MVVFRYEERGVWGARSGLVLGFESKSMDVLR